MKKLLLLYFLLIAAVAQSQDQITLKFIRPAISSTGLINIKVHGAEFALSDGVEKSVTITPDFTSSLRIDCEIVQGPKINYYLEIQQNKTYVFEVGPKKTGVYIKLLRSVDGLNSDVVNQSANEWNTNVKVDRKSGKFGLTAEKEGETAGLRDDWLKQGGVIKMTSALLTLVYFRMDLDDMGVFDGNGFGFSVAQNRIKLKPPQFKSGLSTWSALNLGYGVDFNTYGIKTESNISGSTVKMNMRYINLMYVGNIGYTIGFGKYLDENNWKGAAITLKYRPSLNMSISTTTTTMNLPMVGEQTETNTENNISFNPGGFGIDWELSNFTSTLNKIAPPPKMKISFFVLPPIGDNPLFISFSLGIVYYGVSKGSKK